jgi:hypothetical protein
VRKGAMLDSGIIVWIMLETTKRGGEAESESLCQLDGIPFLLLKRLSIQPYTSGLSQGSHS